MLLAHHPELIDRLREPTERDPWRVLLSGCLAGWPCGVDGTDYSLGPTVSELLALPTLRAFPFCPEEHAPPPPTTCQRR